MTPVPRATLHNSISHKENKPEKPVKAGGTPTNADKFLKPHIKMRESLNTSNGAADSMNFSPRRALQNLDSKIFMRNILKDPQDDNKQKQNNTSSGQFEVNES